MDRNRNMIDNEKKIVTIDKLQRYHTQVKSKLDEKLDKQGGLIEQDLTIQGKLNVKGTTTTVNQESITVDDNIIVTNAHGSDATPYTGVVAVTGHKVLVLPEGSYTINTSVDPSTYLVTDVMLSGDFTLCGIRGGSIYFSSSPYIGAEGPDTGYFDVWEYDYRQDKYAWRDVCVSNPTLVLNKPLVITDDELQETLSHFLHELHNDTTQFVEVEEAYATAIYNTTENEIQLGLGYITRTDNDKVEFTFGGNENQSVATRTRNIIDGNVVQWDNVNKTLVDSGKSLTNVESTLNTRIQTEVDGIYQDLNQIRTESSKFLFFEDGVLKAERSTLSTDDALVFVTKSYVDALADRINTLEDLAVGVTTDAIDTLFA